ncbi:LysR family transcriptional regulator [Roseomonas gilardii]|uniref:LysR family transcriptional regulator n=1 Tax=Roseomonas gilardii TaxID=257708 RepID=UPI000489243E|nr:LysR family transcriptional regulator [Roseomonas gilardii]
MDTCFLYTFLTVVETGSMAEAARRLNITPSAVTQRMRALEADLGYRLLQRAGQHMETTPSGAAILAQARQMVLLAEDMRASSALGQETGQLRIGVIQTALTGILPDILVRLREKRPGIDLYLVPGASGDLYRQLVDVEIDLGLIVKPHFPLPKAYDWQLLRREPLILITAAGRGTVDVQKVLRQEPFIRYDRNHWGGRAVDQYLRQHRIHPKEKYELDSLEAIVIMVSRGLGVSIIPDWPAPWPADAVVERHTLADTPHREVGMFWSRTSRRLPLIHALLAESSFCSVETLARPQQGA